MSAQRPACTHCEPLTARVPGVDRYGRAARARGCGGRLLWGRGAAVRVELPLDALDAACGQRRQLLERAGAEVQVAGRTPRAAVHDGDVDRRAPVSHRGVLVADRVRVRVRARAREVVEDRLRDRDDIVPRRLRWRSDTPKRCAAAIFGYPRSGYRSCRGRRRRRCPVAHISASMRGESTVTDLSRLGIELTRNHRRSRGERRQCQGDSSKASKRHFQMRRSYVNGGEGRK